MDVTPPGGEDERQKKRKKFGSFHSRIWPKIIKLGQKHEKNSFGGQKSLRYPGGLPVDGAATRSLYSRMQPPTCDKDCHLVMRLAS